MAQTDNKTLKNKNYYGKSLGRLLGGALLLSACLLVIFLSYISLDLALIAGVIVTLAAFFDLSQGKNRDLEQLLQSTLHDLSARQDALEESLLSQQEELRTMQHFIGPNKPADAQHKHFRFDEIIPGFLKPQGWQKNPQAMIDDDDDDHLPSANTERTAPLVEDPDATANEEILLEDQSLSDMVVRELVHHAVRNHRIDVFIQPILRLPQRQTKFYEMFARIRAKAGVYLPAKRYMTLASEENVMPAIDNLLLLHGLQALRKNRELDRVASFFINVKPATLRDGAFMRDLLDFLGQNRDMAPSLIFEMQQDDFNTLGTGEQKILKGLARLGCGLSLDNVSAIPSDIKFLMESKIRFVKISADKLLNAARTDRDFADMLRQKRKLEANGIGVIIEKIETETDLLELLDFNVNYGQGFLFGKPDLQGVYARRRAS